MPRHVQSQIESNFTVKRYGVLSETPAVVYFARTFSVFLGNKNVSTMSIRNN